VSRQLVALARDGSLFGTSVANFTLSTATRWGSQVLWDTMTNELKDFWPDTRRRVYRPKNTGDER